MKKIQLGECLSWSVQAAPRTAMLFSTPVHSGGPHLWAPRPARPAGVPAIPSGQKEASMALQRAGQQLANKIHL